jgi:hypothetical protein
VRCAVEAGIENMTNAWVWLVCVRAIHLWCLVITLDTNILVKNEKKLIHGNHFTRRSQCFHSGVHLDLCKVANKGGVGTFRSSEACSALLLQTSAGDGHATASTPKHPLTLLLLLSGLAFLLLRGLKHQRKPACVARRGRDGSGCVVSVCVSAVVRQENRLGRHG